ncbi:DNA-binding protein [Clostridium polyendosporum]|uniref:DNA-binding protein n=1 Tax=Clostridium polyendosporum TaxID=69208 RepID=A0A919S215_9CLOT|nr:S1-like domain-containing RNA-binding protein [Clostridium polyendosporum]GIM30672.1 DNA-binding protein [Clostridium polyendosporum]
MFKIGDFNDLKVVREASFGFFLDAGTGNTSDDILLPNASTLHKEIKVDDVVHAFIYRDSKDRLVATLQTPLAKVEEIAYLKVKAITNVGAFVDIGLERDVLVPMKEQKYNLEKDKSYLFYIYEDKTGRLAATTDISPYLDFMEDAALGQEVTGIIYGFQTNDSLMVAVEGKYEGVVLKNEYFTDIKPGEELNFRVKKIYEDGRLGLTPRGKKLDERDVLSEKILKYLEDNNGVMPFNDKSSPEAIKREFNTSKNYFKIALGGLMRKKLIEQNEEGTKLIKK